MTSATEDKMNQSPFTVPLSSPPQPRSGFFLGLLDSLIGPGATTAELVLQFGSSFIVGGSLCYLIFLEKCDNDDVEEISWQRKVMVMILGIDMIGGIVTNSTSAAKRWYHREGQGFLGHMTFIIVHAIQIGTVSCLFVPNKDEQWKYFGLVYGLLLLSSTIVLLVPLYLQRPTAMALVGTAIPLSMSKQVFPETPGMEWFIPLLFLKLLVSHLSYETAFQPLEGNSNTKKEKKTS